MVNRTESSTAFEQEDLCCGCFLPGALRGRCVLIWDNFSEALKEKVKLVLEWFRSFFSCPPAEVPVVNIGPSPKPSSSYSDPPQDLTPSNDSEEKHVEGSGSLSESEDHLSIKRGSSRSSSKSSTLNIEKLEEQSGSGLAVNQEHENLGFGDALTAADYNNCFQEIWRIFGHKEGEKSIDSWNLELIRAEYAEAIDAAQQARKELETTVDFTSLTEENVGLLAFITILNFIQERKNKKELPFKELQRDFNLLDNKELAKYKERLFAENPENEYLGTGSHIGQLMDSLSPNLYSNPFFTFVLTETFFTPKKLS